MILRGDNNPDTGGLLDKGIELITTVRKNGSSGKSIPEWLF